MALGFTNVQEVLKDGGRSVSASRRVLSSGRAMVTLQVALTIVLLAGAGLMFKSVWQMTTYPQGFAPDKVLTMRMDFRGPQYREQKARHDLAAAILAKAQGVPGVRDAAISTGRSTMLVIKEGESIPEVDREAHAAPVSSISAGFPRLIGMSLASGRWFEEVEPSGSVLINQALARRDYSGVDPLGQRIRAPWIGQDRYATIIGVVSDLKYAEIDVDTKPEVFFHHTDTSLFGITLLLRVDDDPTAMAPSIRKELSTIDPTQSFYDVQTMEAALAESIAPRRFQLVAAGHLRIVRNGCRAGRLRRRGMRLRAHAGDWHSPRPRRRAGAGGAHDRVAGHEERARRNRRRLDRRLCGHAPDPQACCYRRRQS
jgi:hypothetical protein